jgi:hypothetical protein
MVVKKKGSARPLKDPDAPPPPKKGLKELLGDHYDQYWILASLWTKDKNHRPMESAMRYMDHIHVGATDAQILAEGHRLKRTTSDPKYMPQLAKWLAGQDFLAAPPPDLPTGTEGTPNRWQGRAHAE